MKSPAFELGVEAFCKKAGYDPADTKAMKLMLKLAQPPIPTDQRFGTVGTGQLIPVERPTGAAPVDGSGLSFGQPQPNYGYYRRGGGYDSDYADDLGPVSESNQQVAAQQPAQDPREAEAARLGYNPYQSTGQALGDAAADMGEYGMWGSLLGLPGAAAGVALGAGKGIYNAYQQNQAAKKNMAENIAAGKKQDDINEANLARDYVKDPKTGQWVPKQTKVIPGTSLDPKTPQGRPNPLYDKRNLDPKAVERAHAQHRGDIDPEEFADPRFTKAWESAYSGIPEMQNLMARAQDPNLSPAHRAEAKGAIDAARFRALTAARQVDPADYIARYGEDDGRRMTYSMLGPLGSKSTAQQKFFAAYHGAPEIRDYSKPQGLPNLANPGAKPARRPLVQPPSQPAPTTATPPPPPPAPAPQANQDRDQLEGRKIMGPKNPIPPLTA